jgi:hypothetical protein
MMEDVHARGPTRNSPMPAMLTVTDGRRAIGFLLKRHGVGGYAVAWKSFDREQRSLGIFGSERAAAAAIPEVAS